MSAWLRGCSQIARRAAAALAVVAYVTLLASPGGLGLAMAWSEECAFTDTCDGGAGDYVSTGRSTATGTVSLERDKSKASKKGGSEAHHTGIPTNLDASLGNPGPGLAEAWRQKDVFGWAKRTVETATAKVGNFVENTVTPTLYAGADQVVKKITGSDIAQWRSDPQQARYTAADRAVNLATGADIQTWQDRATAAVDTYKKVESFAKETYTKAETITKETVTKAVTVAKETYTQVDTALKDSTGYGIKAWVAQPHLTSVKTLDRQVRELTGQGLAAWGHVGLDKTVSWASGNDLKTWSDPTKLGQNLKTLGSRVASAGVEFVTGKGIDDWRNVRDWTLKDWATVAFSVGLWVLPGGALVGTGARIVTRTAARPLLARAAGIVGGKAATNGWANLGRAVVKPISGRVGNLTQALGSKVTNSLSGAGKLGQVGVARTKNSVLRSAVTQMKANSTHTLVRKAVKWNAEKGLPHLANYLAADLRNPLIQGLAHRVGFGKAATVGGKLLDLAKTIKKGSPLDMVFSPVDAMTTRRIASASRMMQKGVTHAERSLAFHQRMYWQNVRTVNRGIATREALFSDIPERLGEAADGISRVMTKLKTGQTSSITALAQTLRRGGISVPSPSRPPSAVAGSAGGLLTTPLSTAFRQTNSSPEKASTLAPVVRGPVPGPMATPNRQRALPVQDFSARPLGRQIKAGRSMLGKAAAAAANVVAGIRTGSPAHLPGLSKVSADKGFVRGSATASAHVRSSWRAI